ncbi:MAG TPA: threonine--tRNA ligase [Candidatus Methylacidiphilales bacterium]|jgi:threonyl-tRNA synthetase|nr:threonine--tRNA ligase [Candidatus Methylacidiphilales bacterium]
MSDAPKMTDLERVRHSAAHVLATALLKLWPEAQLAAGPPVENGFYYDVELPHRISPADFEKIEAEMKAVVDANQPFTRSAISRDEALKLGHTGRLAALSDRATPSKFKLDILNRIPEGEEISLYTNGDFVDLCAGPHVMRTGNVKAFKLTHVSSTYYLGDEKNPQLQRIYGTAFKNKTEMEAHFNLLEEAKKRDHRKLGRDMQLFHIDEDVGQGLILWTPNGAIIRNELQNFISRELTRQGYSQVFTPHIGKLGLYRTSGHFPYYKESQYPPIVERETLDKLAAEGCSCAELSNKLESGEINGYLLKPMNCPHHIKIFASQKHSYRDLPIRLAEFGTVYRWEQSGELGGMTRVRAFTQDDAHLFCTEEQLPAEVLGCLNLVKTVFGLLDMKDYRVRVGLRDPDSAKYTGDPANWDKAEKACRDAAASLGVPFTEEPGEAAFYGPKIDFVVKDVIGREWQLGTVQVDYNLPERFDLSYTGSDGKEHRPVMVHRAPFGSMERFIGCLIEHFAGHFPTWLAPEQVRLLTVTEVQNEYAQRLFKELKDKDVRVTLDDSREKLGAKIRLAELAKVPYILTLGERESQSEQVSVRSRKLTTTVAKPWPEFFHQLLDEIANRSL